MHSDELSERAITSLKGIGPARAEQFARMGLFSLRDLLGFMPRGYLDFSRERCISDIEDGEAAAVHVEFIGPARTIRAKKRNGCNKCFNRRFVGKYDSGMVQSELYAAKHTA